MPAARFAQARRPPGGERGATRRAQLACPCMRRAPRRAPAAGAPGPCCRVCFHRLPRARVPHLFSQGSDGGAAARGGQGALPPLTSRSISLARAGRRVLQGALS
eukprot:6166086-Prymnesium_polylepis.2